MPDSLFPPIHTQQKSKRMKKMSLLLIWLSTYDCHVVAGIKKENREKRDHDVKNESGKAQISLSTSNTLGTQLFPFEAISLNYILKRLTM